MNSSNSANGEGNTKPHLPKQIAPSKRWCLTLNNPTIEEEEEIRSRVPNLCTRSIIYREVGDSGTEHFQGYLEWNFKCRPSSHKFSKRIHWEKAKANWKKNKQYCSKDGVKILEFGFPKEIKLMTLNMLRSWQKDLVKIFEQDEDPLFGRKVYWFCDEAGGKGKSITAKYMVDCMGAMLVQGGNKDVLYGIQQWIEATGEAPRLIIFDIPRVNDGHVSYQAIESIKNGMFFSSKYESGMCRFNSPHICIFSNEEPEWEKLTKDRWIYKDLESEMFSSHPTGGP